MTKIIWIYWHQGFDVAPRAVNVCVASWRKHNPTWEIRTLSADNLHEYLDPADLLPSTCYPTLQKLSNHVRVLLLAKYGGVWADATLYCHRPLDEWIHEAAPKGFFVFSVPNYPRAISNWFIVNLFPLSDGRTWRIFEGHYRRYFADNRFRSGRLSALLAELVDYAIGNRILLRLSPGQIGGFWDSWFARRLLRLTPYYIFHYLFAKLLESDSVARAEVESMALITPRSCFDLSKASRSKNPIPLPEDFDSSELYLSKFSSKLLPDELPERHFN